jgi:hypothetical protein
MYHNRNTDKNKQEESTAAVMPHVLQLDTILQYLANL